MDDDEKIDRAIGRFIFNFSHLENELRSLIWDEIDQDGEFLNDVMFAIDVAPLCHVALSVFRRTWSPAKFAIGEKIVKRFMAINDLRNKVVHGLWFSLEGGPLFHTSRQGKSGHYDNQIAELEKVADEIDELWSSIRKAARERLDKHYGSKKTPHSKFRLLMTDDGEQEGGPG